MTPASPVTSAVNPLLALAQLGQSVWLDALSRDLVQRGKLQRLINEDGVCGVTSNPAIFLNAIQGTGAYQRALANGFDSGLSVSAMYEHLLIADVQAAADLLDPVYRHSGGRDGYVSLEISPHLADDYDGSCAEARRMWHLVARPNLLIKIPATAAGVQVLQQLTAEGLNINATLLFSRDIYQRILDAYQRGLEMRFDAGEGLAQVHSVASFFVSRIDTSMDQVLAQAQQGASPEVVTSLRTLQGKTAVASAKLAYQDCLATLQQSRWRDLAGLGGQPQRLLWASTSTKNPDYRDVKYVEALIGPDTINTLPEATLASFRDHGQPRLSLIHEVDSAHLTLATLHDHDISLGAVTDTLLREGIDKFVQAYESALSALADWRADYEAR